MSRGSGRSLSEIVDNFDKTSAGYVQWCASNGYGPSQDDSVVAYLAAQSGYMSGSYD